MNAERVRTFLLALPHVVETEQWGGLVFWVGDRDVGGKMFVMLPLDGQGPVISYAAGQERFGELVERDGIVPAPYMARIFWVAAEWWDVFREREWEDELRAGHAMVLAKLPPRVRATLELPKAEYRKALEAGRKRKAEWEVKEAIRKAEKASVRRKSAGLMVLPTPWKSVKYSKMRVRIVSTFVTCGKLPGGGRGCKFAPRRLPGRRQRGRGS